MEQNSTLNQYFEQLSFVASESFYVLDVLERKICYVKPNDLFLCGFSVDDVLGLGYDFYPKVVYSDDLSLWTDMHQAVLKYVKKFKEQRERIDYFSCTFRLQRKYSFISYPLPQMICHRMKPFYENEELRYLLCSVGSSISKKAGNLFIRGKAGLIYEEYSLITKRWKQKKEDLLTERERVILMLARQGENSKEIANYLYKGHNTIRNQVKALFSKLSVHTMQEAIEFAVDHCLIHPYEEMEPVLIEKKCKRKRVLLTVDMMQRIQTHLDNGKSIRHAAKLEDISESAIRYWIDKGMLDGKK